MNKIENPGNRQTSNFDLVTKDDKVILTFKGKKNTYEIAEADANSNLNDYDSWGVSNFTKSSSYSWVFNDKRPHGKYIRKGFERRIKGDVYIVDFVSIDDNHFDRKENVSSQHIDHILVMKIGENNSEDSLSSFTKFKI